MTTSDNARAPTAIPSKVNRLGCGRYLERIGPAFANVGAPGAPPPATKSIPLETARRGQESVFNFASSAMRSASGPTRHVPNRIPAPVYKRSGAAAALAFPQPIRNAPSWRNSRTFMKISRSTRCSDCPQIRSSNAALNNKSATRAISLASSSETIVPLAI